MKDATITDVAERADVSKSTVSAVINDRDVVKDTTRKRVLDAIQELNYRPRRSSGRASGKNIGFVIKEAENPYYAETLVGIQEAAAKEGYLTFASSSERDFETEKQIIDQFSSQNLDGIIIAPILNNKTDLSHIFELKRYNIPFVLLEKLRGIQAHLVDIDNVEASSEAAGHLIELGHERIVHFAGPTYSKHTQERIDGVQRAFSQSRFAIGGDAVVHSGDAFDDGYEQGLDYFQDWNGTPTAATCYNDLVALGLMKALEELDLKVPEDVSVVGFDNLNMLDYYSIPLTTVNVPKHEMGRRATELLLRQIESGETGTHKQVTLDADLVHRSSTAPPHSKREASA